MGNYGQGERHIAAASFAPPSWLRSVADFGPSTFLGFGSKIRRFGNIPLPCSLKQSPRTAFIIFIPRG